MSQGVQIRLQKKFCPACKGFCQLICTWQNPFCRSAILPMGSEVLPLTLNLQDCNRPARPSICCGLHSQEYRLSPKAILDCSTRWRSDAVTCWLCEQSGLILADGILETILLK